MLKISITLFLRLVFLPILFWYEKGCTMRLPGTKRERAAKFVDDSFSLHSVFLDQGAVPCISRDIFTLQTARSYTIQTRMACAPWRRIRNSLSALVKIYYRLLFLPNNIVYTISIRRS